jgi:adenylyltransferase/sulfurtransferase
MTTLRIPTPLRPYAGGESEIEIQAENVRQALTELTTRFPALRQHLYSETGELRAFVNLFVNDEDIRHLQGVDTPLSDDDRIMIIPSIAGGQ